MKVSSAMNNNWKFISLIIIGVLIIGAAAINKELKSDDKIGCFIGPYKDSFAASDFIGGVGRISFMVDRYNGIPAFMHIYISVNGNEVTKGEYERAIMKEPEKNTIVPNLAEYDYISDLHEGLAVAVKQNGSIVSQEYYFINERGEEAFGQKFDFAYDYSDGLAVVIFAGDMGKFSVINLNGETVLKTAYTGLMPFSEGLAPFFNSNKKKWGYIDINGNKVIPEMFENVSCFQEGLAAVEAKEGWGYIKNPLL